MDKQLLILPDLEESDIEEIKKTADQFEIITEFEQADFNKVELVFGWDEDLEERVVSGKHSIKWIQLPSAGIDTLPTESLEEQGVLLTTASGIHASGIAQSILAMVLSYYRGVLFSLKNQMKRQWNKETELDELQYKTMMIVGTGSIGEKLADYAKSFDMTTIGINRSGGSVDHIDTLYIQENIDKGLPEADIVVNILPSTNQTKHFFDQTLFKQMKKDSIFVNVGRGDTVSTTDLIQALDSEKIKFAALDVFEEEPLPENSELWDRQDVLITPHISGKLHDYNGSLLQVFYKNLESYVSGKDLPMNVVDYKKGY